MPRLFLTTASQCSRPIRRGLELANAPRRVVVAFARDRSLFERIVSNVTKRKRERAAVELVAARVKCLLLPGSRALKKTPRNTSQPAPFFVVHDSPFQFDFIFRDGVRIVDGFADEAGKNALAMRT